jgi:hypothetical protein
MTAGGLSSSSSSNSRRKLKQPASTPVIDLTGASSSYSLLNITKKRRKPSSDSQPVFIDLTGDNLFPQERFNSAESDLTSLVVAATSSTSKKAAAVATSDNTTATTSNSAAKSTRQKSNIDLDSNEEIVIVSSSGLKTGSKAKSPLKSSSAIEVIETPKKTETSPRKRVTSNTESPEVRVKLNNCSICLDRITEVSSTHCGHVFCYDCIRECVKKTQKCPICRKRCNLKQIHRLYLG